MKRREQSLPESSVAVEFNTQRHEKKRSRREDGLTQSQREASTSPYWTRYIIHGLVAWDLLPLLLFLLWLPSFLRLILLALQFSAIAISTPRDFSSKSTQRSITCACYAEDLINILDLFLPKVRNCQRQRDGEEEELVFKETPQNSGGQLQLVFVGGKKEGWV